MPFSVRLNCTCAPPPAPGPRARPWTGSPAGICGGWLEVEVALVDQPLDELVEQLGELRSISWSCSRRRLAAQRLEHLGGELARLHQRLEDRLLQRVERAVAVVAHVVVPERRAPAGEAGLEQEVGELVEQRLEIDRVGQLGGELGVGGEAHG